MHSMVQGIRAKALQPGEDGTAILAQDLVQHQN